MAPVSLRITSPSPQVADFSSLVDSASTVGELKALLEQQHERHPPAHLQKLIFLGRLLADSDTVAEAVARGTDEPHVLHLVVSAPKPQTEQRDPQAPPLHPQTHQPYPRPRQPMPQAVPRQQGMGQGGFGGMQGAGMQGRHMYANGMPPFMPQGMPMPQQGMPMPQHGMPMPQQGMPGGGFHRQIHAGGAVGFRLDLGLMAKIAIFVFVLSQRTTTTQTYLLVAAGIVAYLYITGTFRMNGAVHRHPPHMNGQPQPRPQAAQAQPAAQQAERAEGDGAADVAAEAVGGGGGIAGEINDLVVPFFASLLPSWDPRAHERQAEQQQEAMDVNVGPM